jgi:UTP--glucose-1-phosphate uridylyltransferase
MKECVGKMEIKKAVIPAAGLGTRFLPATKSMPKEMLPIIDTPAIHYVVKEAVDAGIDDIIIITGRGKRAIEDYFDESPELEMHLRRNKKEKLLQLVKNISSLTNVHYIRQKEPRGLPDAILKAEKHVGNEPFAVLLGDDIIKSDKPCVKQLIETYEKYKSSIIAVQKVPLEKISRYGSVKGRKIDDKLYVIEDIVEKPEPEKAPSDIAAIGRYVFTSEIFDCIKQTPVGINNELQIADSINLLRKLQKVYALEFSGKRYDIGDKLGYVQAIIDFSLAHKEIGKDVFNYIKDLAMH